MESITETLLRRAPQFGISLSYEMALAFSRYSDFLNQRNNTINLTAITDSEDTATLHFLDSLSLFLTEDFKGKSIIDIGSGAGFPGIPIKLAEPTANVTLLDATGKRITFLKELSSELELDNVICLHARAEEAARPTGYRDSFDISVSRAVARLNILCELCMPFVKVGGHFIAMKGPLSDEELLEAENAIQVLGGQVEDKLSCTLPDTQFCRTIIKIVKLSDTPDKYPRRFSKIRKSPL